MASSSTSTLVTPTRRATCHAMEPRRRPPNAHGLGHRIRCSWVAYTRLTAPATRSHRSREGVWRPLGRHGHGGHRWAQRRRRAAAAIALIGGGGDIGRGPILVQLASRAAQGPEGEGVPLGRDGGDAVLPRGAGGSGEHVARARLERLLENPAAVAGTALETHQARRAE